MHAYRAFIQSELDARGWTQADLVRHSGLRRQLLWNILNDDRDAISQMPEDKTLQAIADGFGIPVERVRAAAQRSLRGYATSDEAPPGMDEVVRSLPTDVLFAELRRRTLLVEREESQRWAPGWSLSSRSEQQPTVDRAEQGRNGGHLGG